MGWADSGLFNEKYRVVAVEAERLTVKGIITGIADDRQQRPGDAS